MTSQIPPPREYLCTVVTKQMWEPPCRYMQVYSFPLQGQALLPFLPSVQSQGPVNYSTISPSVVKKGRQMKAIQISHVVFEPRYVLGLIPVNR